MSIGLSELWTRLVHAGILDPAGCQAIASSFAQAHRGSPPEQAGELTQFMLSEGLLTPFQADALLAQPPRSLRLGPCVLRGDQPPAPFSRWVEVARIPSGQRALIGSGKAASGFLLRTTPGNSWLDRHAELREPGVEPFELETLGEHVAVFTELAKGQLLLHQIAGDKAAIWKRSAVCQIGIALAEALTQLHAVGLIHGSLRADRVWITEDGHPVLLRDPGGPAATGLE